PGDGFCDGHTHTWLRVAFRGCHGNPHYGSSESIRIPEASRRSTGPKQPKTAPLSTSQSARSHKTGLVWGVCIDVCVSVCIDMCVSVCVRVCVCVCVCVCRYV